MSRLFAVILKCFKLLDMSYLPIRIPDSYFLTNLNAARLACRQLGVKDADFYRALSEYSVSL